jgi:cell division protease FtsH
MSFFGGGGEREQTLNQLLDCLDGFQPNSGVVVLAATNRPDILDAALVRRFNRRVALELPDLGARLEILRVLARPLKLAPDAVSALPRLARQTTGFSGADLRALLNEAAIFAARQGEAAITASDCQDALDKRTLGLVKQGGARSHEERELAAVHEAGRAVVSALMPERDDIVAISILPRLGGKSGLGATVYLPSEERISSGLFSRCYLLGRLSAALGGRAAEELRYGPAGVTVSSADDLRQVAELAHAMVESTGLSKRLFTHAALLRGARANAEAAYLGLPVTSPSVASLNEADDEVRAVVAEAYARALETLRHNRAALDAVTQRLIVAETMTGDELANILRDTGAVLTTSLRLTADEQATDCEPGGDGMPMPSGGDRDEREEWRAAG